MQLFYHEFIEQNVQIISFDKDESRHISNVLRKKIGDILHITNGKGYLFEGEILSNDPKNCVIKITKNSLQPHCGYRLHIAIAPTKMNERFEWFLEKATEIGISKITPIICENSERKIIKLERFEKVILSAIKQSLWCYKPEIVPPISFMEFIENQQNGLKYIAHCYPENKQNLGKHLSENFNDEVTILIGPEGDFSALEVEKSLQKGFLPVSLGDSRLRTETAGIVATNIVSMLHSLKK